MDLVYHLQEKLVPESLLRASTFWQSSIVSKITWTKVGHSIVSISIDSSIEQTRFSHYISKTTSCKCPQIKYVFDEWFRINHSHGKVKGLFEM